MIEYRIVLKHNTDIVIRHPNMTKVLNRLLHCKLKIKINELFSLTKRKMLLHPIVVSFKSL